MYAWAPHFKAIKKFHERYQKPVVFTEYGYMSVDGAAWEHWELEANERTLPQNTTAQSNAYEALFRKFWSQDWFAGGFLWKWYHYHDSVGQHHPNGFTPQNKPVEEVIHKYYR